MNFCRYLLFMTLYIRISVFLKRKKCTKHEIWEWNIRAVKICSGEHVRKKKVWSCSCHAFLASQRPNIEGEEANLTTLSWPTQMITALLVAGPYKIPWNKMGRPLLLITEREFFIFIVFFDFFKRCISNLAKLYYNCRTGANRHGARRQQVLQCPTVVGH
jgi:hypothetical protein